MEIVIVLVIALLILGPKRLPGAARSVGTGLREFKDSLSSTKDQVALGLEPDDEDDEPATPAASREKATPVSA